MKPSFPSLASLTLIAAFCCVGGAAAADGYAPLPAIAPEPAAMVPLQAAAPAPRKLLSAADRENIQRVISLQIRAFARNEEAIAFSYATPDARRYFGSPAAFMEVVRSNYKVLYRNISQEFLEAAVIGGVVVQPLKILTTDGEILIALYTVEQQADREWRIGSCELAPSLLQAI